MPSFDNKKQLRFIITLGTEKFGSSNDNQIILQGFRAGVDIDKAGGVQMGTMRARIYGVKQDDMNSITTLQWRPQYRIFNTVDVYAIDGEVETLVFSGNIVNAWGDYQNPPDVFLHIQAQAAFKNQVSATTPLSIKGGIDVAIVMQRIAGEMGLAFENNNVHVMLNDVYVSNTLLEQARDLARAANFRLHIDDKILAITNIYEPRQGDIPRIASDTGLVGYPTFDGVGVNFRTLFNPAIRFGGAISLETSNKHANGQWIVTSISHSLESERPDGPWYSQVRGTAGNIAVVSR